MLWAMYFWAAVVLVYSSIGLLQGDINAYGLFFLSWTVMWGSGTVLYYQRRERKRLSR